MKQYYKRYLSSEFVKNVFTLSLGAGIAGMFPVILSLVLVKYYSPENFGALAFFVSSYAILAVIATGRYELAIIVPKEKRTAINLLYLSITLSTIFCGLLLLLTVIVKSTYPNLLGIDILGNAVYMIPVAVWLTAIYQSIFYFSNREKKFKLMSGSKIVQNGTIGMGQLILGVMGFTGIGLILGRILGLLAGSFNMLAFTRKEIRNENYSFRKDEIVQSAKTYSNFPGFMLPAHGMATFYGQLPVFFITSVFGNAVTGFYSIANQWLAIPNVLIARSMGDVFRQRAMEEYQSTGRFDQIYRKTIKTTFLVGLIPFLIAYFSAPYLFEWFYGSEWAQVGKIAQILIIGTFFSFVETPMNSAALVVGNTKYIFYWHFSNLLFQLINILICYLMDLDLFYFLYGLISIRIAHYVFDAFFNYMLSCGRYNGV